MPVFISHRTQDDVWAQRISVRLASHKIATYLDHFDPTIKKSREITAHLVACIKKCTHLMALVTDATKDSWWVPFEIGVAREAPRRITSYDKSSAALPEYLTEWPILRTDSDLDAFAETYHRDTAAQPLIEKYTRAARTILSPDEFHRNLKAKLGQP